MVPDPRDQRRSPPGGWRGGGGAEPSGPPLGTLVGLNQQAGLGCQSLVLLDVVLLEAQRDPLGHLQVLLEATLRTAGLRREEEDEKNSEQLVWGGRRTMKVLKDPVTSSGFTSLVVKSFTQSMKQFSVSLLYVPRNSLNCSTHKFTLFSSPKGSSARIGRDGSPHLFDLVRFGRLSSHRL